MSRFQRLIHVGRSYPGAPRLASLRHLPLAITFRAVGARARNAVGARAMYADGARTMYAVGARNIDAHGPRTMDAVGAWATDASSARHPAMSRNAPTTRPPKLLRAMFVSIRRFRS